MMEKMNVILGISIGSFLIILFLIGFLSNPNFSMSGANIFLFVGIILVIFGISNWKKYKKINKPKDTQIPYNSKEYEIRKLIEEEKK
jgi:hypothetical protein